MRLHVPRRRHRLVLAAMAGLAIGGSFLTSDEARAGEKVPAASPARPEATDVSAARRQRHVRRPPIRSNADSMASQPPDRPSFGYGIGDNSTYGGG